MSQYSLGPDESKGITTQKREAKLISDDTILEFTGSSSSERSLPGHLSTAH